MREAEVSRRDMEQVVARKNPRRFADTSLGPLLWRHVDTRDLEVHESLFLLFSAEKVLQCPTVLLL